MRWIAQIPLACSCLLLGGCVHGQNDRLTLGAAYESPALSGDRDSVLEGNTENGLFHRTGNARSEWTPIPFVAHFDGVVHGRLLRVHSPLHPRTTARAYGRFPARTDALDPQAADWGESLWSGVESLGRSTIGSGYALLYLAWHGELFKDAISPMPYKRTRQPGWSSGQPATTVEDTDE